MKNLGRIGVVGRFKPLHKGGALMLEAACENADYVIIGIGSSNKYNVRNPFTAEESKEMIDRYLSSRFDNYSIIFIPDFGHIPEYSDGQKWRKYMLNAYGKLDHFVSGNDYVRNLLKEDYDIIHPGSLIPKEKHLMLRATEVRVEMARHGNWKAFVPEEVVNYLEDNGLVERFRKEFGLQTLANLLEDYNLPENIKQEREHIHET